MFRSPRLSLVYRVNSEDFITSVDDNWDRFARENSTPELVGTVVGTWLWKHLTGSTVLDLNRAIVTRVRKSGNSVAYPFRCDAPTRRRDMELILRPLSEGDVEFESWVMRETPREPILLFDHHVHRSSELITMCAWCLKVKTTDWVEAEVAIAQHDWFAAEHIPGISHGICPQCFAAMNLDPQTAL